MIGLLWRGSVISVLLLVACERHVSFWSAYLVNRLSGALDRLQSANVSCGSQAAIVVATSDFSFLNQLRSSTNLAVAVVPGHHS